MGIIRYTDGGDYDRKDSTAIPLSGPISSVDNGDPSLGTAIFYADGTWFRGPSNGSDGIYVDASDDMGDAEGLGVYLGGGGRSDVLIGGFAGDSLDGGGDVLIGGPGGDGFNNAGTISYATAASAVTVDWYRMDLNTGDAAGDFYDGAPPGSFTGSDFGDTFRIDNAGIGVSVGAGDDTIAVRDVFSPVDGGSGDDTLQICGGGILMPDAGAITHVETIEVAAGLYLDLSRQTGSPRRIEIDGAADKTNVTVATAGGEAVTGGDGHDEILAGGGDDKVAGGGGDDILLGQSGADKLSGGAGADTFAFFFGDFGEKGHRDHILDFSGTGGEGDRTDLTSVANFTFIGVSPFDADGSAELRTRVRGDVTTLFGDINGDGAADFKMQVTTSQPLTAADFVSGSAAMIGAAFVPTLIAVVAAHIATPEFGFAHHDPVHPLAHLALA